MYVYTLCNILYLIYLIYFYVFAVMIRHKVNTPLITNELLAIIKASLSFFNKHREFRHFINIFGILTRTFLKKIENCLCFELSHEEN